MNKMIFGITIIGVLIIITIATVIKVNDVSSNEKYDYIIENFIYYSKKCVSENKCTDEIVTLKQLYDNNYLDKQINPKTKKPFNVDSYINVSNYKFILK